jgi:hypothetical protein
MRSETLAVGTAGHTSIAVLAPVTAHLGHGPYAPTSAVSSDAATGIIVASLGFAHPVTSGPGWLGTAGGAKQSTGFGQGELPGNQGGASRLSSRASRCHRRRPGTCDATTRAAADAGGDPIAA